MLVDAREIPSGTVPPDAAMPCPAAGTTFPTAYELTGPRENEIAEYVGRRVVLTGMQKEAKVRPVGTSGVLRPTGGFDPLGHELHLFEVEANTFHDVTATLAEAPAAAPPPAAPSQKRRLPPHAKLRSPQRLLLHRNQSHRRNPSQPRHRHRHRPRPSPRRRRRLNRLQQNRRDRSLRRHCRRRRVHCRSLASSVCFRCRPLQGCVSCDVAPSAQPIADLRCAERTL
jgi:hypothetical protein